MSVCIMKWIPRIAQTLASYMPLDILRDKSAKYMPFSEWPICFRTEFVLVILRFFAFKGTIYYFILSASLRTVLIAYELCGS